MARDFVGMVVGWTRRTWRRVQSADVTTKRFLALLVGWIAGIGVFAVLRYDTFQTNAFDLGIFNQAFSTTLHGRLFYETPDLQIISSGSFLGVHFNLLMFLLLPPYALVPRPETLLVIQSLFIGLGAVPVWLISIHVLHDRRMALLLAAAYLFNPGTLSLSFYDFHLEAFLPFFLGMTFYSYLVKRWRSYALYLVLSLITLEFAAILIGAMSLAHLVRDMRSRRSSERGGSWFGIDADLEPMQLRVLVGTLVLSPVVLFAELTASGYLSGGAATAVSIASGFMNLGAYGNARFDLLADFWLVLFGVLLFLPVLSPRNLVTVAPWLVLTFLPAPTPWYLIGYQYGGAFAAPFLIWGAVFALRRLPASIVMRRILPAVLLVSVLAGPLNPVLQGVQPGIAYEQGFPIPTVHTEIIHWALGFIPSGASVLAQNNLFPQVSNRDNAYVYLPSNQTLVEFVFADISSQWYTAKIRGNQSMSYWLPYFLSLGGYGIVVFTDGVVVLEKGYTGPPAQFAATDAGAA